MDTNLLGFIISLFYLGGVIGIGYLLNARTKLSSAVIRKVIHIGVTNWWFILIFFFEGPVLPLLGTGFFVVMNYLATRFGWSGKYFGLVEEKRHYGLVYYPVSLLVLVLLIYYAGLPLYAATSGVLAMGYGDGIAALVGHQYGRKKLPGSNKTWLGSAVMCIVSFSAVFLTCYLWNYPSSRLLVLALSTALVATLLEAASPYGLDNIAVPLGTALWMVMPWW